MNTTKRPKVVIVGAGFGGVALAKKLRNKDVDVWLIDKHNYHTFQPLLYQVATGGLEPDSIAYPIRRIFRKYKNVEFRMAEVQKVDRKNKVLLTSIGRIAYDYLVIATGATNNFFNFAPVKDKLLALKSMPDALNMRSFIMQNLEKALNADPSDQSEITNVVIVGGGPAGVELAGAVAEMKRYVLPKDFPRLDLTKMNIYVFEAAPRVLAAMSEDASTATMKYLKKMGVTVQVNTRVKGYDGQTVDLGEGNTILADTVIWTAGVKGFPIPGLPEETIVGGNRIAVDSFLKAKDCDDIYAIGDVAAAISEDTPRGHPMLAPVAIQQGKLLAKNIVAELNGKAAKPFVYNDKGVMATVGRQKAVVDLPKWGFQGAFAWFVWMFIHILSIIGFRNKIAAFIGWLYNYFSYDRPLGLIIRPYRHDEE